jgi:hypothetical protein
MDVGSAFAFCEAGRTRRIKNLAAKVRAPLKITFTLQRYFFALTVVQLTEIAYLSHFFWPHQPKNAPDGTLAPV